MPHRSSLAGCPAGHPRLGSASRRLALAVAGVASCLPAAAHELGTIQGERAPAGRHLGGGGRHRRDPPDGRGYRGAAASSAPPGTPAASPAPAPQSGNPASVSPGGAPPNRGPDARPRGPAWALSSLPPPPAPLGLRRPPRPSGAETRSPSRPLPTIPSPPLPADPPPLRPNPPGGAGLHLVPPPAPGRLLTRSPCATMGMRCRPAAQGHRREHAFSSRRSRRAADGAIIRPLPGPRLHAHSAEGARSHALRAGHFPAQPPSAPGAGQVSAFTVAHSITLGLSIYGVISVPAAWSSR